jgi:hypothetical protein
MTAPKSPTPEDPKVCAMIVCDHAHRDAATGKFTLLGIFDRIHARAFPGTHGPFSVYVNLTNLNGHYRLALECLRGEDESRIAGMQTDPALTVRDPLAHVEFAFGIPSVPVEKAGSLVFRLLANGRMVHDAVLWVVTAPATLGGGAGPASPPPPPETT